MRISDWSSDVCSSDLRPLAPRGRRAAAAMGAYLRTERLIPDFALCSTARRARETFVLAAAELDGDVPVRFLRELDRKRVVEGKGVSVRVDFGGRRIIKKKKTKKQ